MTAFFFILTVISLVVLLIAIARLGGKLEVVAPNFKQYECLIIIAIMFAFASSYALGVSVCKSDTDIIKDYNKGLYQEKITYESIDGNIIPQDTVYIFKNK